MPERTGLMNAARQRALALCALGACTVAIAAEEAYFLRPRYESESASERIARAVAPGTDAFPSEEAGARIAERLRGLGRQLRRSPGEASAVASLLAEGFAADGWSGRQVALRPGPALRIDRVVPETSEPIGRAEFEDRFRALVRAHDRIEAAEFEVAGLSVDFDSSPARARTKVRFEFVGTAAADSSRALQQMGEWTLEWERSGDGAWRIRHWTAGERRVATGRAGLFTDVSDQALAANPSSRNQLRHGVDHWRAKLDDALGIDVYGHQGISAGDIDGDGDDDLYVSQPAGLPNRLLRNEGGFAFRDVTDEAGVGVLDATSMSLIADLDNDGDQDLTVITAQTPLLFRNDGTGAFRHDPAAFSIEPRGQLTSAAAADYDNDGDLDLYVCAYRYHGGLGDHHAPTPYHDANNGPPNHLLRNRGDGTFEDATDRAGLGQGNTRFSFAASWADYDGDLLPDLYVANDFGRNNLYRNRGDGTFEDVAALAGAEDLGAGMSASWLDYDRDGRLDLYVGNMWSSAGLRVSVQEAFHPRLGVAERVLYERHAKGNTLFRSEADGTFSDVTFDAGVEHGRWAWSSDALDVDNDGNQDLYIANGYVSNTDTNDL